MISTHRSKSIFIKVVSLRPKELFALLDKTPGSAFAENNLVSKEDFINNLLKLVNSIEQTGDLLAETKEMRAAGSIAENWFPVEFKILRSEYTQNRKKLVKQLELINLLFINN